MLLEDGASSKHVTLPDELFLRELRDIDLASELQVLAFVNRYGLMTTHLPTYRWAEFEMLLLPVTDFETLTELTRELVASERARIAALVQDLVSEPADTVRGFSLMAGMLRNATRVWLAVCEVVPWSAVFSEWEAGLLEHPRDERRAAWALEGLLNWGLAPFHAEVRVFLPGDSARDENPFEYGGFLPSTFSTICLQIANHMTQEATYHQCGNETCGRFFYRQRGRAEFDQYRTSGVKYCSVSCARTQSSRDSRRKAKERAAGSHDHGPSRKSGRS